MNSRPGDPPPLSGILLIDKPRDVTSFSLVRSLRRRLQIQKIGHAGTLDPFATGVMVMLVGRAATRLSTQFLTQDKEYLATLRLGEQTDTYDCTGHIQATSPLIPSPLQVEEALVHFQGRIEQIPPMFCAKSVQGKRLYTLARQGIEIERQPIQVELSTQLLSYAYPHLQLHVRCSKGTYIRSLADALGKRLGCGAHLSELIRTRSGPFLLEDCIPATAIDDPHLTLHPLPPP